MIRRKGAWAGLSFWAAVAAGSLWNRGILALAALGIIAAGLLVRGRFRKYVLFCCVFFLLGLGSIHIYDRSVYDRIAAADGQTLTLSGQIVDRTQVSAKNDAVTLKCRINGAPARVTLIMPYDHYDYYKDLTVTCDLELIRDSITFSAESYYSSRGIYLRCPYTEQYTLGTKQHNRLLAAVKRYRDRLYDQINFICPSKEGAFLGAMLCGEKRELSSPVKTALYRSGMSHIIAVSGTHLVMTSGVFGALIGLFIKRRRSVYVLTLAEIWAFALFSGLAVPVVRAAFMMTLSSSGFIFGRKSDGANSLGLAALILSLFQPYSVLSPSFIMSFTSCFGIGFIAPRLPRLKTAPRPIKALWDAELMSVSAVLITAPVVAWNFGSVSVLGLITGVLLVPLCIAALMLSSLCLFTGGISLLAYPFLVPAALLVKPVLYLSDKAARLPFAVVPTGSKVTIAVILITAILPLILGLRTGSLRQFSAICAGTIAVWFLCSNIIRLADDHTKLIMMPYRYSAGYLLETDGSAILFDLGTGGGLNSAYVSYTDRKGITNVTAAFISDDSLSTVLGYKEDMFFCPECSFVSDKQPGTDRINGLRTIYLPEGDQVHLDRLTVTPEKNGFLVIYNGQTYELSKTELTYDDSSIEPSQEGYPIELDLDTKKVRRLSYAFD